MILDASGSRSEQHPCVQLRCSQRDPGLPWPLAGALLLLGLGPSAGRRVGSPRLRLSPGTDRGWLGGEAVRRSAFRCRALCCCHAAVVGGHAEALHVQRQPSAQGTGGRETYWETDGSACEQDSFWAGLRHRGKTCPLVPLLWVGSASGC